MNTAAADETLQDVQKTLGGRRWRLFGLSFGPHKIISEVQLRTDDSGLALGAFARVDGRWVTLKGDLFARIVDRQFAALQPVRNAQGPSQALDVPRGQNGRLASLLAHAKVSDESLASSAVSTPKGSLWSGGASAASSATTLSTAAFQPANQEELSAARWQKYCDITARPETFATNIELVALSQVLQRNIRVISQLEVRAKYEDTGDVDEAGEPVLVMTKPAKTNYIINDVIAMADPSPMAPLLVHLADLHYRPLVGKAANEPALTELFLNADLGPEQRQLVADAIADYARPVPGDGSCLFHSVAMLLGEASDDHDKVTASDLRARAVDFLRQHGQTFEVRGAGGFSEPLSSDFMYNLSRANREELLLQWPDLATSDDKS